MKYETDPSAWFFIKDPPETMAFLDIKTGEITVRKYCSKCKQYTDDPKHKCKSVALVKWKDTPWFSTVL